jgi:sporulation integral membrane protein YtvI
MDKIPYISISNRLLYIAVFAFLIYSIFPYLTPFLLALIVAVLFEPIVLILINKCKLKRSFSVTIVYSLFLISFLSLLTLGFTKIIFEIITLSRELPVYLIGLQEEILALINQGQLIYEGLPPEVIANVHSVIFTAIDTVNGLLKQTLSILLGLASALPKLLILLVVVLVSIFLMSFHLPKLKKQFLSFFGPSAQQKMTMVLDDLNAAVIGFVRAQVILSFFTYIITFMGLILLDIKYALSIALVIVVVDILPVLGTGAVIVPWVSYLFYQGSNETAIGLVILYLVIVVFRRIAEPKVLGDNIGISALATIMSMYLGFEIFGAIGIFAGPVIVIVFQAVRRTGLLDRKINF